MPEIIKEKDVPAQLSLKNGNDDAPVVIQIMGPNDANMGIVFWITPSGTQHQEIRFWTDQSNTLAARLNTARLLP